MYFPKIRPNLNFKSDFVINPTFTTRPSLLLKNFFINLLRMVIWSFLNKLQCLFQSKYELAHRFSNILYNLVSLFLINENK